MTTFLAKTEDMYDKSHSRCGSLKSGFLQISLPAKLTRKTKGCLYEKTFDISYRLGRLLADFRSLSILSAANSWYSRIDRFFLAVCEWSKTTSMTGFEGVKE